MRNRVTKVGKLPGGINDLMAVGGRLTEMCVWRQQQWVGCEGYGLLNIIWEINDSEHINYALAITWDSKVSLVLIFRFLDKYCVL